MQDKTIKKINELLKKDKLNRKQIYEHLLAEGIVKPNSEKLVYETLDYGLKNGMIQENRIKIYHKKSGKLPVVYSMDQLIKIFDNIYNPKLAVCVWLGFFCGLRIREVCNLKIKDLNLQDKLIIVKDSKSKFRTKEGYGKDRIVTIPEIAISPLKKWLEILQGGEWLIPSMQDTNKPIKTKTIHEQYRQLLKSCDLNEEEYSTTYRAKNHNVKKEMHKTTYLYKFHTLRHTYATYLLDKGVPLENIQKCLGHNQLDTTLVYARVRDNKTKDFVNEAFNTPLRLVRNENILTNSQNRKGNNNQLTAEDILKQRLAKGEIDIISYKRLMAEINPDNTINLIVSKRVD